MTSEHELWGIAHEYVRQHGQEAFARALARIVELRDAGDGQGVAIWPLVAHRITQLRSAPDKSVH